MQRIVHDLPTDVPGTRRALTSLHFGAPGPAGKAYLQAGLHADELPGQLVLWHVAALLEHFEAAGRLRGELVLVPSANPIGQSQGVLWDRVGRFELYSGQNFNRHFPDIRQAVADRVAPRLCADGKANATFIRDAIRARLRELEAPTELAALRLALLRLAMDADVVLDLHCDLEAVLHIYTTYAGQEAGLTLSRHLGARALLLADDSGGNCFDETCSGLWDALRARFGQHPIAAGCFSATVELRGQADVSDALAAADAAHLVGWLGERGFVDGPREPAGHAAPEPTPLAGSEELRAPVGGILAYRAQLGDQVTAGQPIADLIDPATGHRSTVSARNEGVFYVREHRRFVRRGTSIGLVTGRQPVRTGPLLSA